jgi:hypothetical protein
MALADLYDEAGRQDDAAAERLRARNELMERASKDVRDAWHELALLEASDPELTTAALAWAERDWGNRKDVHAADALAWGQLHHGDTTKAEATSKQALAPGYASPMILLHAALIDSRDGRSDEARALAERARACPVALSPGDRLLARSVDDELASRRASR